MFGGLGIHGRPEESSVINMFEGSFTEEGTGAGNAISEGGFILSASKARNNLYSTASGVQREEDRSSSPSTREHQKLGGRLKNYLSGERSGSDRGANMEEGSA